MSRYVNGRLELTMAEWTAMSKDFKGITRVDGKIERSALHFVPGVGTSIVPVVIIKPPVCGHNTMTERPADPAFAWQCADCGHVYGKE